MTVVSPKPPIYLFDWGNTLMVDNPNFSGPMCDWPELEAIQGAVTTLEQLSSHAICCLATNANDSSEQQIRAALERVGLNQYLTHVFCSQALGCMKPHADYFAAIKATFNDSEQELIMVGDSLEKDILGAQACGFRGIWYNPQGQLTHKDIDTISSLTQLLER